MWVISSPIGVDAVVDYVLRFCANAWTVHDYCVGGCNCLKYFADVVEYSDYLCALLDEVGVSCGGVYAYEVLE